MNPLKINDTTYELTLPLGDMVEIGDKDSADFKPCARLNRWGTEGSLVLSVPTTERILPTIQGEKILWQKGDFGAEFFTATDGFKFNIVLPRRPGTNVFPLDFGSDNLKFYYQPPLTEEFREGWSEEFQAEIKVTETQVTDLEGNVLVNRPENVVGSYAVYHASKGSMHASQADAEKYRCGKAFHWYRPLIYDKAGHQCWGILNVNPKLGLRTVTIPQEFLDNAVYPVVIDDDFGYTSQGGSTKSLPGTNLYADGHAYNPSSDGSADSLSAYLLQSSDKTPYLRLGCYESDNDLAFESEEWQLTEGFDGLKTFNVSGSPAVASATSYFLAIAEDDYVYIYYDSGGTAGYKYIMGGWGQGTEEMNVKQILAFVLGRVGLKLEVKSQSSVLTGYYPDFTINPGNSGDTIIQRLLSFVPDVLFIEGGTVYVVNPLAADDSDYGYGQSHPVIEGRYRQAGWGLNRVQVEGYDPAESESILVDSFSWEQVYRLYDRLERVEDRNLDTAARAGERGEAYLRQAEMGAVDGAILTPVNCGQQLYDVVDITEKRAGLDAAKRRVVGLTLAYRPRRGEYQQRLLLGGV